MTTNMRFLAVRALAVVVLVAGVVVLPPSAARADVADPGVASIQQRLWDLGYDPGPVDGIFGQATEFAVFAFQKVQGLPVTGAVGGSDLAALQSPFVPSPVRPDGGPDHVEIDLAHQLLLMWRGGVLGLVSTISSGNGEHFCVGNDCRNAVTPVGDFAFQRFVPGWENGPLGPMYNPIYFTTDGSFGMAVHGSNNVPLYPASHGCVRIPMHTAERFPNLVSIGEPVFVY